MFQGLDPSPLGTPNLASKEMVLVPFTSFSDGAIRVFLFFFAPLVNVDVYIQYGWTLFICMECGGGISSCGLHSFMR